MASWPFVWPLPIHSARYDLLFLYIYHDMPTSIYTYIESPLRRLLLVADDTCLTGLYMAGQQYEVKPLAHWVESDNHPILQQAQAELTAYFAGSLKQFRIPVALNGTPLQRNVWHLLQTIPYGSTTTYGALANELGIPNAARLIGYIIGHNPVSIIVPCHRVLGVSGSLTGYNGGLDRKRYLLDLENRQLGFGF